MSTPVGLTIGLSIYLAAFIYVKGHLSFSMTFSCSLGNSHTNCFWLTHPPHPVILSSDTLYNFMSSSSFRAGELTLLPNHQTLYPELWISELW